MNINDIPFNQEILLFECDKPYTVAAHNLIIPTPNSQYINIKQCAYRTKPQKRTIIINNFDDTIDDYDEDDNDNDNLEIEFVNVPELLFLTTFITSENKVNCSSYCRLFMIKNNELYLISFLNVDPNNGLICWGDKDNQADKINNMKDFIHLFWNTQFNYATTESSVIKAIEKININRFLLKIVPEENNID